MAKFVPQEFVEPMEFDFTAYGGREGIIPEPTTKQVTDFFKSMKSITREVKGMMGDAKRLQAQTEGGEVQPEDIEEILEKIDSMEDGVTDYQNRLIENLAVLCGGHWKTSDGDGTKYVEGGSPSVEELQAIPYRVMQAFSQWLIKEVQPKRETPGTSR